MGALLVRLAEVVTGLLAAAAFAYLPLLGYYSVACSEGGAGWALVSLLLLPLAVPPFGILLTLAGFAVGLVGRPFHRGTSFWSWAKWLPVAGIVAGLVAWGAARLVDAQARCSFGF